MRMLWKCIVSASNHCEVYRQRWLTQYLLNAIIYSAGRGRSSITGTGNAATVLSLLNRLAGSLRLLDSWSLWVFDVRFRRRCTSANLYVTLPPAVTGGRERELVKVGWDLRLYTDVYWRWWQMSGKNRIRQYRTIFIACVIESCTTFCRTTKVVRYRTRPIFLVWYGRNAAMWLVGCLLFVNKMEESCVHTDIL